MPITVIKEEDSSQTLVHVYYHECSLGEFMHRYEAELREAVKEAVEKKERFNWHDISQKACGKLEKDGTIIPTIWQSLCPQLLIPSYVRPLIAHYNIDPSTVHIKFPEKEGGDKDD